MKKILLLAGFIIAINCITPVASSGQTAAPAAANHELVLGIPLLTDKDYNDIKNTLAHTDGITLLAFCDTYKFFLMTYDPTKIKSGEAVGQLVEAAYPAYKTEVKVGTSIATLINDCSRFPLPATGISR